MRSFPTCFFSEIHSWLSLVIEFHAAFPESPQYFNWPLRTDCIYVIAFHNKTSTLKWQWSLIGVPLSLEQDCSTLYPFNNSYLMETSDFLKPWIRDCPPTRPYQDYGIVHGRIPLDFVRIIIIHKLLGLNVLLFCLFLIHLKATFFLNILLNNLWPI